MMEGWRSVEGGKSLKGACERLLEESEHHLFFENVPANAVFI